MTDFFNAMFRQPYQIITLALGAAFLAGSCITINKDYLWVTHPPTTFFMAGAGIALIVCSLLVFSYSEYLKRTADNTGRGVDFARVKESDGVMSTMVGGCEIRVVAGRLEEYAVAKGMAVVLPCNEYFDDRCVDDTRSALGAYVNRAFDGQASEFVELMKSECRKKLGPGTQEQKTDEERAESFGTGRCMLILRPLGRSVPVALLSTTTQRVGEGLASRISYLFSGMRDLVTKLANERINEIVMPVLGAGHGGLDPPLALVGLLGAVAEAARYGQGAQRLKSVTIVLFKKELASPPQVDPLVVRRALALVGSAT